MSLPRFQKHVQSALNHALLSDRLQRFWTGVRVALCIFCLFVLLYDWLMYPSPPPQRSFVSLLATLFLIYKLWRYSKLP